MCEFWGKMLRWVSDASYVRSETWSGLNALMVMNLSDQGNDGVDVGRVVSEMWKGKIQKRR